MSGIVAPCKGCTDREPGCHSERCKHGWPEYVKRRDRYYRERHEQVEAETATAGRMAKKTQQLQRIAKQGGVWK